MSEKTGRTVVPAAEEILGGYFPVLDHGFVSLVDYMGSDVEIERAARVSYGTGTRKVSQTRDLVRYLHRHAHTTPSEMVEFKFHCAMPIFVARQWIRHRTASVNEYSARYSIMPMRFYMPDKNVFSPQSETNKQGRENDAGSDESYSAAVKNWQAGRERQAGQYEWLLEENVARELARIDLPLSTYTQWYWKIDLHNLLHFLTLRVDPHAQYEIRAYANVIAGMVERVAPLAFEAWMDYDVMGVRFSRAERNALSMFLSSKEIANVVKEETPPIWAQNKLSLCGLSKREVKEFLPKLEKPIPPSFSLDPSVMRSAEEMEQKLMNTL